MIKVKNIVLGMCQTNCYVVYHEDDTRNAIIIDPAADAYAIRDMIDRLDVHPRAILLTHGHFDHMLAAVNLKNMYDIKVYAADEERDVLENCEYNLSLPFTGTGTTIKADEYYTEGTVLTIDDFTIKTILIPGHTKGGTCYYFEDEGVLVTGDTLFAGSVGRSDFPTGSASTLIRNIKDKLFILPGETICYPGHGEATSIENEKMSNPFF